MSQGFARGTPFGVDFHVAETLYFTASDTFEKANYPGLWGVRVKVQGGGGGGGGCQGAGAGQGASAGGGGGGGYVEALILAEDLTDSVTVTVGAGGGGGAAGHNNGSPGGDSSFGAYAVAGGGGGGNGSGVTSGNSQNGPGAGGNAPTGDLRIRGFFGGYGMIQGGQGLLTGFGGASHLGASVRPGDAGQDGIHYGGGGSGARNATAAGVARAGGAGADGIVIVEVLYDRKLGLGGPGYLPGETLYFTSSDTFEKAEYPGLRAIKVKVQGAGGGGGGSADTSNGEGSYAGGGAGGGYAEKFILASELSSSESVTVGTGGSGGSGGASSGDGGGNGGSSSFGSHCSATGGNGGNGGDVETASSWDYEGSPGDGSDGDINLRGEAGGRAIFSANIPHSLGHGGASPMAVAQRDWGNTLIGSPGPAGNFPGGGGAGAITRNNNPRNDGGNGADGIVIVELFY